LKKLLHCDKSNLEWFAACRHQQVYGLPHQSDEVRGWLCYLEPRLPPTLIFQLINSILAWQHLLIGNFYKSYELNLCCTFILSKKHYKLELNWIYHFGVWTTTEVPLEHDIVITVAVADYNLKPYCWYWAQCAKIVSLKTSLSSFKCMDISKLLYGILRSNKIG
jgi:hypothetical protein